jgi:hypothetical protein
MALLSARKASSRQNSPSKAAFLIVLCSITPAFELFRFPMTTRPDLPSAQALPDRIGAKNLGSRPCRLMALTRLEDGYRVPLLPWHGKEIRRCLGSAVVLTPNPLADSAQSDSLQRARGMVGCAKPMDLPINGM